MRVMKHSAAIPGAAACLLAGALLVLAGCQRRDPEAEKRALDYLATAARADGAVRTDTGLVYARLTPGNGASPAATDTVRVHYHGTLPDGRVFDSSVDRGQPASFALDRVIPCWTEGVQRMRVGEKARLVCPAALAYGDRGAGPIPPGSPLAFEVELLGIGAPGGPP